MVKNLLCFISLCFSFCFVKAQCTSCSATTFNVDLSGAIDTMYKINSVRNGNCCTGTNCVRFNITLNPASGYVNFTVANPGPNGAAYYQIDCGPQTSLGVPVCISGTTFACITYCKPGNDNPVYTITTTKRISASADLLLREGCTGLMSVTGLQQPSINWTSVFPGMPGAYNNYLSCTTGCDSTFVTPQVGAPPYIDYQVSGLGICGGPGFDTIRIYTKPSMSATISPADGILCTGSSSSITLTASATGGNPPYSFLWNTGQTTQSITVSSAGTFTVSVSDNTDGCLPVTKSVTIQSAPAPSAPSITTNSPICSGGTLKLFASPVTGGTYLWTGPNGFTSTEQNPVIPNASGSDGGNYSVSLTVGQCTSPVSTVSAIVNTTPAAVVSTSNSPLCSGGTLLLTASSTAGATYSWSGPNGFSSSAQNPSINNITLLNAGTYFVTATKNGCSSSSTGITVVVNTPQTPVVSNNGAVCEGQTLTLTCDTINGATSYSWTGSNGFSSFLQNPVINNVGINAAGTYTVTPIIPGCSSVAASTTVTINPVPAIPVASNNSPVCAGSDAMLFAGGSPSSTYSWSGPGGFSSSNQNPVLYSVSVAAAGQYYVTASENGCTSAPSSTIIVINDIPSTPITSNNSPLCSGDTLKLFASSITGGSYQWTGPNGFSSSLQNPVIVNASSSNSGSYSLAVSAAGCTSAIANTSVIVNTAPATVTAGSNSPLCTGGNLLLTASSTPGATYTWSGPNGFISTQQDPSVTNISSMDAGIYFVTASLNGCTSISSNINVLVNTPQTPVVSNTGAVCEGQTLTLTCDTINGATSYSWTGPNGFSSFLQNPVINNVGINAAGTYTVTPVLPGCTAVSSSTGVVVNAVPAAPIASGNGPLCEGSDLSLAATGASSLIYTWTGPGNFISNVQNPVINNVSLNSAGVYNVTVTQNGCTSLASSTTVVVNSIPPTPGAGSNSPVCTGSNVNLFATTISGASYEWTGPNGFTSTLQNPSISNSSLNSAGVYSVKAIVSGCSSATDSTTVLINAIPAIVSVSNNSPVCSGDSFRLFVSTSTSGTYQWTGPNGFTSTLQNPVIANATTATSGSYSVTVTLAGCTSAVATTSAVVNNSPAAVITSSNSPVCDGGTLLLTASSSPGTTYSWSGPNGFTSSLQNPVISNVSSINAGNYQVIGSLNGCSSAASNILVAVTPSQTPIVSNNGALCAGQNLNFSCSPIIGATSYNWTGPNGFTSSLQNPVIPNVTLNTAGIYTVTPLIPGCSSVTASSTVIVKPVPTAPVATNNSPVCSGSDLTLFATGSASANYSWTGPGNFLSSSQNPVINNSSIAFSGIYNVTQTVNGCTSAAGSTVIVVNSIPETPSLSSNSPVCSTYPINLTASFVSGATYEWTGPNGFTSSLQNPSITNASSASAGMYYARINVSGCSSLYDSTMVLVNSTPASPNVSSNSPVCEGTVILLTAPAINGALYNWTGPGGFSSTQQNPVISNVTLNHGGTYNLTVMVNGCITAGSSALSVLVNPVPATPVVSANTPLCEGSNLSLASLAGPGISYSWSGPSGFISSLQNPVITNVSAANAGIYSCYSILNGCQSAPGSMNVMVDMPPIVDAGNDQAVCANLPVVLSGNVSGTINSGIWSTSGNGTFSPSANTLNAVYNLSASDIALGNIALTLSSAANNSCPVSTDVIYISLTSPASANAGNDKTVCSNAAGLMLNGVVSNAASVSWSASGTGTFVPSTTVVNPTYISSGNDILKGNVMLTLTAMGNGNCGMASDAMKLTISKGPVVDAGPDVYVQEGNSIVFQPSVISASLHYLWTPKLYLNSDTAARAICTPHSDQQYQLTVTDTLGCSAIDKIWVRVLKKLIIPNVFTPNGDGVNDTWEIKNLDNYPGAAVEIFNRYGQKVFVSEGYSKAWDGRYKGSDLPAGTYYYIINPKNGEKQLSGFVDIVR